MVNGRGKERRGGDSQQTPKSLQFFLPSSTRLQKTRSLVVTARSFIEIVSTFFCSTLIFFSFFFFFSFSFFVIYNYFFFLSSFFSWLISLCATFQSAFRNESGMTAVAEEAAGDGRNISFEK